MLVTLVVPEEIGPPGAQLFVEQWFVSVGSNFDEGAALAEVLIEQERWWIIAKEAGHMLRILASRGASTTPLCEYSNNVTVVPADTLPRMHDLQMLTPDLGESIPEAVVMQWRKSEGQTVAEGETLVSLQTDKADIDVPAPATGILHTIVAPNDSTVHAGAVLAVLRVTGFIEQTTQEAQLQIPTRSTTPMQESICDVIVVGNTRAAVHLASRLTKAGLTTQIIPHADRPRSLAQQLQALSQLVTTVRSGIPLLRELLVRMAELRPTSVPAERKLETRANTRQMVLRSNTTIQTHDATGRHLLHARKAIVLATEASRTPLRVPGLREDLRLACDFTAPWNECLASLAIWGNDADALALASLLQCWSNPSVWTSNPALLATSEPWHQAPRNKPLSVLQSTGVQCTEKTVQRLDASETCTRLLVLPRSTPELPEHWLHFEETQSGTLRTNEHNETTIEGVYAIGALSGQTEAHAIEQALRLALQLQQQPVPPRENPVENWWGSPPWARWNSLSRTLDEPVLRGVVEGTVEHPTHQRWRYELSLRERDGALIGAEGFGERAPAFVQCARTLAERKINAHNIEQHTMLSLETMELVRAAMHRARRSVCK